MKKNLKIRQEGALERNAYYAALTPQEQINSLDNRLGKNVGAKKQRAKLAEKLASYKTKA